MKSEERRVQTKKLSAESLFLFGAGDGTCSATQEFASSWAAITPGRGQMPHRAFALILPFKSREAVALKTKKSSFELYFFIPGADEGT